MASRVRFRPALEAARKLGGDPQMAAAMGIYADATADEVRRIAPEGDSSALEGYADEIEAVVGKRARSPVFIGRVNANKFTSHWIEFGTVKMRAFAPLRRALEQVGFRVYRQYGTQRPR